MVKNVKKKGRVQHLPDSHLYTTLWLLSTVEVVYFYSWWKSQCWLKAQFYIFTGFSPLGWCLQTWVRKVMYSSLLCNISRFSFFINITKGVAFTWEGLENAMDHQQFLKSHCTFSQHNVFHQSWTVLRVKSAGAARWGGVEKRSEGDGRRGREGGVLNATTHNIVMLVQQCNSQTPYTTSDQLRQLETA